VEVEVPKNGTVKGTGKNGSKGTDNDDTSDRPKLSGTPNTADDTVDATVPGKSNTQSHTRRELLESRADKKAKTNKKGKEMKVKDMGTVRVKQSGAYCSDGRMASKNPDVSKAAFIKFCLGSSKG
jgi:hypothetical protein